MRKFSLLLAAIWAVTTPSSAQVRGKVSAPVPVVAHYMNWATVPGGWSTASVMPLLRDNPAGGYTSANPAIIAEHNRQMAANGIWPMMSWWGPDTYAGDRFLDQYLQVPGPPLAILYEATGRLLTNRQIREGAVTAPLPMPAPHRAVMRAGSGDDRFDFRQAVNANTFVADMEHLHRKYFSGPHADRFVRVDGRPMVFVWISHAFDGPFDEAVARARERAAFYLVGSDFSVPFHMRSGGESVVRGYDAMSAYGFYDPDRYGLDMDQRFISEYGAAVPRWQSWLDQHAPGVRLLLPIGFAYDETLIPGRRGVVFRSSYEVARRYAGNVRTMVTNPCGTRLLRMAYVTSFNECYEGTCVEPSEEYGTGYLDILRETFAVERDAEPCQDERSPRDDR